jgi:hypothetical protein
MKQTKKSVTDMKLDYEDKFVICMLTMIIGYVEGKYGPLPNKVEAKRRENADKRLTEDDLFNNAYYMFQRLKTNAKKPKSNPASLKKASPK